ncbi:MAG: DnaB-like helicase C-terminal domain-containing protein [Muribaculaceae bacterium]
MDKINTLLDKAIKDLKSQANRLGALQGVPTGFQNLDNALGGFRNSDLIVIGARPAMGKSILMLNMALRQAMDFKIPVILYSFEKSKSQIMIQIVSCITEIEGSKLREDNAPFYIVDNPATDVVEFCKAVKDDVVQTGAQIIYIDNLQHFSSSTTYQSRYEEVSACTRALKRLAKDLNIPIVMSSQINRNPEHRSANAIEHYTPYMYDLRDSGTICEDSNVVILLDRPELRYQSGEDTNGLDIRGLVQLHIAKNHMGKEDTIALRFKPEISKFEDWQLDNGTVIACESSLDLSAPF